MANSKRAQQLQKEYLAMKQKSPELVKKLITKTVFEPIHMVTCIRNGINIYYKAIDNYSGLIAKDDNGNVKLGLETYKDMGSKFVKGDKLWWKVVEALYTQEYFKLPEGLREIRAIEVELEINIKLNKQKK